MLFNSYIFILIFLPLSLIGYYILNKFSYYGSQIFLIAMSFWFYGFANPTYLFIIVSSILFNFYASKLLQKMAKHRKKVLIISIILNIGLIFYFKYFMFTLSIFNALFKAGFQTWFIEMPLGISFFTIQQISFLVDSYRKETEDYGIVEYALYVSFFPQLVAGPIVLHNEMIPQFRDKRLCKVNYENLISGIMMFSRGLFKKIIVADLLMIPTDWGYDNFELLTALEILLVMISFILQLYFDFSAYSDMATGIARMFNWELAMNFDSPLKSLSISEFWRRWHITLNRFLTNYIYIPLGGSRKGMLITSINTLIVFFISGLWHGAYYTFILWGLINGIGCVIYRIISSKYDKIWYPIRWFFTFLYVTFAFGLFRAESVSQWIRMMRNMLAGVNGFTLSDAFVSRFVSRWIRLFFDGVFYYPKLHMLIVYVLCFASVLFLQNNYRRKYKINTLSCVLTAFILGWCVFSLSSVTKFLYFNF